MAVYQRIKEYTKDNTTEFLYAAGAVLLISYGILSSSQFYTYSHWTLIGRVVKGMALLLLLGAYIVNWKEKEYKINTKWAILSLILLILLSISGRINDQLLNTTILALYMISGFYIQTNTPFKMIFVMMVLSIAIVLIFYFLGIFTYDLIPSTNDRPERLFFGFTYTTILTNYFLHILLVYIAIKKKDITVIETIIIVCINQYLMKYTDTRAVYFCVFLLLIFLWILKLFPKLYAIRFFHFLSIAAMPLLALVIIYFSYRFSYDSAFFVKLNAVLSNRLSLGHAAIEKYGFTLFGNAVQWATGRYGIERVTDYFYVDSSYLNMICTYGVLLTIYIVIGFVWLVKTAIQEKKYRLLIALVIVSIHSFLDPQLFELRYDPFLLLLLPCIIDHHIAVGYPQTKGREDTV